MYVAQKESVVSTAYTVTSGDNTAFTSVQGESGSYVPEGTQLYSDSTLQTQLSTAAANTWTYNGDSTENTSTVTGYVKPAGSVFVPAQTQVYTTADLTTPLEVASGSDWVYTGATAVSMIGALNITVEEGANTLAVAYNGSNYTFNSQTLASTDTVRDDFVVYLGSAPSTPDAYFNSTIDIGNADFSFWSWNGISDIKPNFEIVGDVTFNDGVLSNFTTENYVQIPYVFNPNGKSWEAIYDFVTGDDVETNQAIMSNPTAHTGIVLHIYESKINYYASSNGTTVDITGGSYIAGTTTLNPNTHYYIKLVFTATQYIVYLSTTGDFAGEESTEITVSSTESLYPGVLCFGIGSSGDTTAAYPFLGEINLSGCSIKLDNNMFWRWNGITEAGYSWNTFPAAKIGEVAMKSETVEPNYTVVGSPTITEAGVVSGFTTGNYLTTPAVFNPGDKPWKVKTKINILQMPTGTNNRSILSDNNMLNVNIFAYTVYGNNHFLLYLSSNGTSLDISGGSYATGSHTVTAGTYYVQVEFTGTQYILSYSQTGEPDSYIPDITIDSTTPIYGNIAGDYKIGSGRTTSGTNIEIDLSELSFEIDNKVVYKWNGYTAPTEVYSYGSAALDYPVELVKKEFLEERLAGKTDWEQAANASMPSTRYIDLTLGASGTEYTAPADGWVCLMKGSTGANQYVTVEQIIDGKYFRMISIAPANGQNIAAYLPVAKGAVFMAGYSAAGALNTFRFYYAQGAKND